MSDEMVAVTPEEAARRLSSGRTAVYQLIKQGRLAAFKLGNKRLVPVWAIESLVADLASGQVALPSPLDGRARLRKPDLSEGATPEPTALGDRKRHGAGK